MAFGARPTDELAELVDPRAMLVDPFRDPPVHVGAAAVRQELDPQLLEVACEPRRE